MHALAVALPSIRLQPRAIERLFGPQQFATVPNFLDPALVAHLVADVHSLGARLTPAAASPAHGSVEWLMLSPDAPPQDDSDDADGVRAREALLTFVDDLQRHIESQTGVALDAHCELKYAHYPCGGRYQKHVDGVAWRSSTVAREYSFLLYLNDGWLPRDGGHLRVFGIGGDGAHVDIAPAAGTLVVFKSDVVPHEVRPTFSKRLAIVGWFHRHVEPVEEEDDEELSPLARAIMEHYRAQGKDVKVGGGGEAR